MITLDQAHDLRSCIQQGIDQVGDWREALSQALATADQLANALTPPPVKHVPAATAAVFMATRERTIYPAIPNLRQTVKLHFQYKEGSGGIVVRFTGHRPHRVIAVTTLDSRTGKLGRDGFEAAVQTYITGLTDLHLAQQHLSVMQRDSQPSDLAKSERN